MGMNTILILIAGIVMSTIIGTQVAPSIVEGVKVKKTQVQTINNQEVIFEAIKRYTTIKQVAPTSIDDLIIAKYIDTKVNDNGFGGTYEIEVVKELGVATITTTIVDPKVQEAFLNSFMGTSKPSCKVDEEGICVPNKFETKYVLPNEVMHGNALLMTGIPIGSTPPDHNTNKYWYDTKDGKAILKIYDNDSSSWIEVNLGGSGDSIPIQNTPPDPTKYSYWYDSSVSEKLTLRTYVGGVWKKVKEESAGSTPSGSIIAFAGTTIPDGYLLCNGQEISRLDYEDLFEAIGTTYGSTSGTTFKVPDLRGEFIRGFDDGRGVDSGRIFGSWQKGTANAIKNAHRGHLFNIEANAFEDNQLARESVGLDKADYIHYQNIRIVYLTNNITGAANDFMNHSIWGGGITRPRNVAMNYIIKY